MPLTSLPLFDHSLSLRGSNPSLCVLNSPTVLQCFYQNSYTVSGPRPEGYTIYYYPCGLVARSRFNDTFQLAMADGTVVPWTKKGIAWRSNADSKYKSKDEAWLRSNCFRLGGQDFDFSGFPESLRGFSGTGDPVQSRYDCWQNVEVRPCTLDPCVCHPPVCHKPAPYECLPVLKHFFRIRAEHRPPSRNPSTPAPPSKVDSRVDFPPASPDTNPATSSG